MDLDLCDFWTENALILYPYNYSVKPVLRGHLREGQKVAA